MALAGEVLKTKKWGPFFLQDCPFRQGANIKIVYIPVMVDASAHTAPGDR